MSKKEFFDNFKQNNTNKHKIIGLGCFAFFLLLNPSGKFKLNVVMSVKLELSNDEAREYLDRWAEQLLHHQGAADALMKKIAAVEAQLNGQALIPPQVAITKSGKRKKGENLRALETYLRLTGVAGATVAAIHKMTNLPISSCNAVLKRHDDIFARGTDGLWRIKRDVNR